MYLPESLQEVPGQIVVFSAVRQPGDVLQVEIFNASPPDELPEALSR